MDIVFENKAGELVIVSPAFSEALTFVDRCCILQNTVIIQTYWQWLYLMKVCRRLAWPVPQ